VLLHICMTYQTVQRSYELSSNVIEYLSLTLYNEGNKTGNVELFLILLDICITELYSS